MEFGRIEALYTPTVGSASQTVQHKGREESSPRQKGKRPTAPQTATLDPADELTDRDPDHRIDIRI